MKKTVFESWKIFALLVSLVAVTSCDDDDGDIGLNLSAEEFVQQAAVTDMFEIQTGQMAVDKSETSMVVDFGQMIVDDHMQTNTLLSTLADEKNITMPTALTEEKRAIRDRLAGKDGVEFDKDFADSQVQAHEEAVELYERATNELDDDELRAFAETGLPILQQHLQEARDLKAITDAM
ncbi:DUF4142 domain-containing protein [Pontibacter silvestris]|uniref:DUF4142 domain-containing protein n=1 Tax=Pontibacter silvestris TaxID=2305183 RepID=A0ABW4X048_9BACT|nr:DUF4142 domain-containing protein [Pontibacter silvestris]MCC9135952.1 DUF4142 domain-containing protein [Pontibacter silvestris]